MVSFSSLERTSVLQLSASSSRSVSSGNNCGCGQTVRDLMDYEAKGEANFFLFEKVYF